MYSILVRIISGYLLPLLLFFSLITYYRGHNAPGGGFIGGLLAALAYILIALAYDQSIGRKKLFFSPLTFISLGLAISVVSGLLSSLRLSPFLKGLWFHLDIPLLGEIHLGTPMLFDLGVFLTVMGITVGIVFTLLGED